MDLTRVVWDRYIPGKPAASSPINWAVEPVAFPAGLVLPLSTSAQPASTSAWIPGLLSHDDGTFYGFQPSVLPGGLDGGYVARGLNAQGQTLFFDFLGNNSTLLLAPPPGAAAPVLTTAGGPRSANAPLTRLDDLLCLQDSVAACSDAGTDSLTCFNPQLAPVTATSGTVFTGPPSPGVVAGGGGRYLSPNVTVCGSSWNLADLTLGKVTFGPTVDVNGCAIQRISKLLAVGDGSFIVALTVNCSVAGLPVAKYPIYRVGPDSSILGAYAAPTAAPSTAPWEVVAALADGRVVTLRNAPPYATFELWALNGTVPDVVTSIAGLYDTADATLGSVLAESTFSGADGSCAVLLSGATLGVGVLAFRPNLQPLWFYVYPRATDALDSRLVSAPAVGDVYLVDQFNNRAISLRARPAGTVLTPATIHVVASTSTVQAGDGPVALTALTNSTSPVTWTLTGPGQLSATTGPTITWTPPIRADAHTTAQVTASISGPASDTVSLGIGPAQVATITLTPGVVCEAPTSGAQQLTAVVLDIHGTQFSPALTWTSADPTVATVAGGLVTLVGSGLTTVSASAEGKSSNPVTVSVRPPPAGVMTYSAYDAAASTYRARMVNLDGTSEKVIADGWDPRLSPDKTAVVYRRGGSHYSGKGDNLYVWDFVQSSEHLLYSNNDFIVGQTWTNDSKNVIFDYACSMLIEPAANVNTGAVNFFNTPNCYDDAPDTNPVDGRVVFENTLQANILNLVDSTGANRTNIPGTPTDQKARWSHDGSMLAVMHNAGGFWRLDALKPDGTGRTILTTFPLDAQNNVLYSGPWTADGNWVVVPISRGTATTTTLSIQAVAADGSGCMVPIPAAAASSADSVGSVANP